MIDYREATEENEYQIVEKKSGLLMATAYSFLTAMKAQGIIAKEGRRPVYDYDIVFPAKPLDRVPLVGGGFLGDK